MANWSFALFLALLILGYCSKGNALYYTSLTRMKNLVEIEQALADKLMAYVEGEEDRLDTIEDFLNDVEQGAKAAWGNEEVYMSHPTDSFKIFDRIGRKWAGFSVNHTRNEDLSYIGTNLNDSIHILLDQMPEDSEEKHAVYALFKLQVIYNLTVADLADGFGGTNRLTPKEMFDIGAWAGYQWDYELSQKWMLELWKRIELGQYKQHAINMTDLYYHLAYASYKVGDLEIALQFSTQALALDPDNYNLKLNHQFYVWDLQRSHSDPSVRQVFTRRRDSTSEFLDRYDRMCRGEETMPQYVVDRLNCSLYTPHESFILKPLQREIVYNGDPYIVAYRNFLTDWETNRLMQLATPQLDRAQIYNPLDGNLEDGEYRISNNAWLEENVDPIVKSIRVRVGNAVHLNMKFAEPLQVNNYGIAGNYDPHCDHAVEQEPSIFGFYGSWGNRIATALMYFTDVDQGGQTAFVSTEKGVLLNATKGTVVFWYNLKRNGQGNPRTRHAACPVLLGEKWVANLWIHEKGQEFHRPCSKFEHE